MLSGLLSFDLEELHARLALEAPQPTVPSMAVGVAVGNFALPSVVGELKQAMQAAFRAKFVVTGVAAATPTDQGTMLLRQNFVLIVKVMRLNLNLPLRRVPYVHTLTLRLVKLMLTTQAGQSVARLRNASKYCIGKATIISLV